MKWQTSRIIDSNGTLYRVGWDEYGWFSIQMVEENPYYDIEPDSGPKYQPVDDQHLFSFTREGTEELIEAIEAIGSGDGP